MLDTISQYLLTILSVIGFFLVARKNKWGMIFSLAAEPFWFYTAYIHRQWGIFINTAIFTGIFIYGVYNWFIKMKDK